MKYLFLLSIALVGCAKPATPSDVLCVSNDVLFKMIPGWEVYVADESKRSKVSAPRCYRVRMSCNPGGCRAAISGDFK